MRLTTNRWLIGGLLCASLAAGYLLVAKPADTLPITQWIHIQPQKLENHLGLVGRIAPEKQAIIAAPFEGLIKDIAITEGQQVKRGQDLIALDTTQLDILLREALSSELKAQRNLEDIQNWSKSEDVARSRRTVRSVQLNLSDTKSKLDETQHLFERGIVARMEVDTLNQQLRIQTLDLSAAEAELQAAQQRGGGENRRIAEMELINAKARYTALQTLSEQRNLQAPFAGVVLRHRKQEGGIDTAFLQQGMRVTPGMPLIELVSLEKIKAVTRVTEGDLYQLVEGMPVQLTGDGFESTLQGHIARIGAQGIASEMYGGSATYEVEISIDPLTPAQASRVRLGMSANLKIVTYSAENGISIPAEALRYTEDEISYVTYREDLDKTPQQIHIETGHALPEGVEVFGLQEGYIELPQTKQPTL